MDFDSIRDSFPITKTVIRHDEKSEPVNLIYMDHAASTHPPKSVIETYVKVMETTYANVHRGEHQLSCLSTEMFEGAPKKIASFLGIKDLANSGSQVVFGSNTTSSLDLASHLFEKKEGIVLSTLLEHHSNDLPHRYRGKTIHAEIHEDGTLNLDDMEHKLQTEHVKLVAVSAGSNVTGYMPPVHKIARLAHDNGAKILIDAAQRLAHQKIDVKSIDHPEHLDFLVGAGHKTYSPFGSSILLGDREIFDDAPPYIPGGGTVSLVTEEAAFFFDGPERHSFGTPNIAGAIAFGASIDFLENAGMEKLRKHELKLLEVVLKGLNQINEIIVYGDFNIRDRLGVVSFNIDNVYHAKVSHDLDKLAGIATRNGCFCAQPYVLRLLNVSENEKHQYTTDDLYHGSAKKPGAVRASIGIYNSREEVEKFLETVEHIVKKNPTNVN